MQKILHNIRPLLLIGLILSTCMACGGERVDQPKPRAYPKIEYPQNREIVDFDSEDCPFTFQHLSYAKAQKDTAFFDQAPGHPCWFDLNMKAFNGQLHFSYYPVEDRKHFDKLVSDAFKLSGKHNIKADYIDEMSFRNDKAVSGVIFDLEGPVASPFQFFITDSVNHFLRGALYINAKPKPDSLQPIFEYVKNDISVILNTFEWK